ncbi:Carbonic anhydrase [Gluconobacter oxydans 621H]|uniref:Carbonic anhydrase n=1 Tax=Gluconobacter oxydans (strain 621H) TaxID=290633 RepID=Q5FQ22_GLUOX|nr:Carbonic anhydrase [Gluconobacter oxydans 621H]
MACGRDTLAKLLGGVRKFETDVYPENAELFESLASSQSPSTLFITCADSRISPSLITQTEPGELFIVRNVGNIVPAYGEMLGGVSSAIEYAVGALKVKNVIICGHSNCGAMGALMDLNSPKLDSLPTVKSWMRPWRSRTRGPGRSEGRGCRAGRHPFACRIQRAAPARASAHPSHRRPGAGTGCAEASGLVLRHPQGRDPHSRRGHAQDAHGRERA